MEEISADNIKVCKWIANGAQPESKLLVICLECSLLFFVVLFLNSKERMIMGKAMMMMTKTIKKVLVGLSLCDEFKQIFFMN